ncbi:alanine racemase [Schaalia sp. 19OD2882]|uniref:alanine racemase n=1 Tax=Schaalia sp. 19OD2882 TaxID=2794089 RepID=UPI001C1EFA3F|nr:alanine racemase [Schaalia sp. 19OD2882]QWW20743.1 alanine racemase [Schaalia sp. 19OD2882]
MHHPGRVVVDLDAIAHNLHRLREAAPNALQMAVVKADAYGHGLLPVALTALEAGSQWLGVAQLSEALTLRAGLDRAGIPRTSAPVLTWIAPTQAPWARAIESDLDLSVSWTWVLDEVVAAARKVGRPARIHLKVDTGMSRAGSTPEDLPALVDAVARAVQDGQVEVVGLWSHLSRADDPSPDGLASTGEHLETLLSAEELLLTRGVRPQLRHLAATSGILWHPDTHLDLVRAGIGLYGLSPDPQVATSADLGLRPAMRIEAPLTSVKRVAADRPVSYGGTWRTPGPRWLGLVPLGYADGILRTASGRAHVTVLTGDGPLDAAQVGRVCMDQFVIDLGPATPATAAPARVGDTVVLVGDPAAGQVGADDWAEAAGTINYEIVTRVGERLHRIHQSRRTPCA